MCIITPCGVCTLRPIGLQVQVVPGIEFHEYISSIQVKYCGKADLKVYTIATGIITLSLSYERSHIFLNITLIIVHDCLKHINVCS